MQMSSVKIIMAALTVSVILSCGSGAGSIKNNGTAPYIYAELDAFPVGSIFQSNAGVHVIVPSSGNPINTAVVVMNGVTLSYNATDQEYKGNLVVAPGDHIDLSITVDDSTYTVSGTQFTAYPAISSPALGAIWSTSCLNNTVVWSSGTSTTNSSFYGLGILSASTGNLAWPFSSVLETISIGTTSYNIPKGSLSTDNYFVIVGIASEIYFPNAAPGSSLVISGFNYVPVTVADTNPTLLSIAVNPTNSAIAKGISQQFTATGSYCDGTSQDLTASASWNSSDTNIATISNATGSSGYATPVTSGTTTITATSGSLLDSTLLTVTNWRVRPTGTTNTLDAVIWSGTQFVAVGWFGTVLTSPDGITWTSRSSNTYSELEGTVWSGTKFVTVGDVGTIITSPDGITWTKRNSGTSSLLFGVAWSGSKFVAVGQNGTILSSPDGIVWTAQSSGTALWLSRVAWSGTSFVVVGGSGTMLTSPDGITWTMRDCGTINDLNDIVWTGTQFFVVGGNATVLTSPDGLTWTVQNTVSTNNIYRRVTWTGTEFIAVGGYYNILTSPDGVTWSSQLSGTNEWLESTVSSGSMTIILQANGSILTYP